MNAVDIAYTCYPVSSLKKAREFYEGTLGLKATSEWVQDDMNGMIEYDIGPATLAIGAGADNFKLGEGGATAALELSDFGPSMKELGEKKCTFLMEPVETSVCHMVLIADPDGNKIMLHQRKAKADFGCHTRYRQGKLYIAIKTS